MNRAYSILDVRAVDDDQRIIEGVASTPATDRMEDIVEPLGAEYVLPLPFLWQHESREAAIGQVVRAKPGKNGIPVTIRIDRDDEPGPLKDRLDYAWRSIKKGLVRGLSIGFRSLETTDIEGTFGLRFLRWEWLELSAVTIPANAEATITAIKSLDLHRTASGGGDSRTPPGASGRPVVKVNPRPRGGDMFANRIRDLENARATKQAALQAIVEKCANEGRTKDASEQEEFDTLASEIEAVNKDILDLQKVEALAQMAKPVDPTPSPKAAGDARAPATVRIQKTVEPGIRMARVVKAMWQSRHQHRDIERVVRELYPDDALVQKAAVAAASTTGNTWGHQLVGDEGQVFADFAEFLRPMTVIGKFGANGIPSLRLVPFRTPLISQTGGGQGYWVGEGAAKPLTSLAFGRTTLEPLKVANIAVATKEVLGSSSPAAEGIIRDSLVGALRERLDIDFVDPTNAGGAATPASITNGAPEYVASGSGDADDIRLDIRSLFQGFIDADNPPTTGVFVMRSGDALALSLLVNALGQSEFPGIGMNGGTFFGLPVITSEHVPSGVVVLVNASDIYLGDEGGFSVDMSTEASLEMKDQSGAGAGAVTGTAITPTAASLVSLWQTNSVGFLAEREINWSRRRASAVQWLSGVAWGGAVTEPES